MSTTPDTHRLDPHRNRHGGDYPLIMTGLALLCLLAAASGISPALDELIASAVTGLALGTVIGLAYRLVARFVRERIEDGADARAGARWWALRRMLPHHRPDSDQHGRPA
jgi:MFS family permease